MLPLALNPKKRVIPSAQKDIHECPSCQRSYMLGDGVVYECATLIENEVHMQMVAVCSLHCLLIGLQPEGRC